MASSLNGDETSLRARQLKALRTILHGGEDDSDEDGPLEPEWKVSLNIQLLCWVCTEQQGPMRAMYRTSSLSIQIIVYDKVGEDILSPLLSVAELREMGVTLFLRLDVARDPVPG